MGGPKVKVRMTTMYKTKVVVRQLPPGLKEAEFREVVDQTFGGKYNWFAYYPGKST